MADVFISYSRKDKDFVSKLHAALREQNRETWVDWQDIPLTADWWQEIERGIEGADTFVFVLSADSIESNICYQEVEHAVKNNKRLVPIVRRDDFNIEQVHSSLRKHNWLFFQKDDEFNLEFSLLIQAIDTDLEYVKQHTQILVRATEWERQHRNDSFLIRGDELIAAEVWLGKSDNQEPKPTEHQINYIHKSREAEDAHNRILQAGNQAKRMVRVGSIALGATLVAAAIVGVLTLRASHQLQEVKTATRLERESANALKQFEFSQLNALLTSLHNVKELKDLIKDKRPLGEYPTTAPLLSLRTILNNIQEVNQIKVQHDSPIFRVALSSDGRYITAVSDRKSNNISLWRSSGEKLADFKDSSQLNDAAFSPDSRTIATVGGDGRVKFWSLEGEKLSEFQVTSEALWKLTFSPNGKTLAIPVGKVLQIWDFTGKKIKEFQAQDWIWGINFSPDGKEIAVTDTNGRAYVWSINGKKLSQFQIVPGYYKESYGLGVQTNWVNATKTLSIEKIYENSPAQKAGLRVGDSISAINSKPTKDLSRNSAMNQLSAKSVIILNISRPDQTIAIFQVTRGKFKYLADSMQEISFSTNRKQLVTAGEDGIVRLWSLTGKKLKEFRGHDYNITGVSFSPDGENMATTSYDGTARLWTLSGERLAEFKGHQGRVFDFSFSSDGKQLITAGGDDTVRLWNVNRYSLKTLKVFPAKEEVSAVALSPGGQKIALISGAGEDAVVILRNLSGKQLAKFIGHQGLVRSVSFSSDGKRVATGSEDNTGRLWDLNGKQLAELKGHEGIVFSIQFSPDMKYIATASGDNTARLWTLAGKQVAELRGHHGNVWDVAFSPDGRQLATVGGDSTARLWNLKGQQLAEFKGHQGVVWQIRFSPDGKYILTGGGDGTARLWTLDGKQIAEFRGHQGNVDSISFSPNGRQIVTGDEEGTIRVWTLDGQQLAEFPNLKAINVQFGADKDQLTAFGNDGVIRFLKMPNETPEQLLVGGCSWLRDYLKNNSAVVERDRHICDEVIK